MSDNPLITYDRELINAQKTTAPPAYLSLFNSETITNSAPEPQTQIAITYDTQGPSQGSIFSPSSTTPYNAINVNSAPVTVLISYSAVIGFTFTASSDSNDPAIVEVLVTLYYNNVAIDSAMSEASIVTTNTTAYTYPITFNNSIIYTAIETGAFTISYEYISINSSVSNIFINGANINVMRLQ